MICPPRLLAVGGSDTHDGTAPADAASTIGKPTTVVYATDLTQPAIIQGLKSGRVFVDIVGGSSGVLDFDVTSGSRKALMGGSLDTSRTATVRVDVKAPAGSTLELMDGAKLIASKTLGDTGNASEQTFKVDLAPGLHPLRVQVRDASGKLVLLSNAVMARRAGAVSLAK